LRRHRSTSRSGRCIDCDRHLGEICPVRPSTSRGRPGCRTAGLGAVDGADPYGGTSRRSQDFNTPNSDLEVSFSGRCCGARCATPDLRARRAQLRSGGARHRRRVSPLRSILDGARQPDHTAEGNVPTSRAAIVAATDARVLQRDSRPASRLRPPSAHDVLPADRPCSDATATDRNQLCDAWPGRRPHTTLDG
jgi:hypothetical protein